MKYFVTVHLQDLFIYKIFDNGFMKFLLFLNSLKKKNEINRDA